MDEAKILNSNSPRLIYNNIKSNKKVIKEIEDNLYNCKSFDFSIAFISDSGIASLMQSLLDIIKKGVKGRIITSTYLGFNNPKMFRRLYDMFKDSNISIRIYQNNGFHPKGYIFNNDKNTEVIIGSSNLTQDALSVNQEWNICLEGSKNDEVIYKIYKEFEEQWKESKPLTTSWIDEYEKNYLPPLKYYVAPNGKKGFEPNKMQSEALECLEEMRNKGKKKSLLISATGTGKTYLSAFDVKQFNAKKMLFVVHRETIARKSLESYKKVISNRTMGMFTGSEKDRNSDYLFSTIGTIGKEEYLKQFSKNEFDYIVIDEVHKAGAKMYEKLLNYFTPKFLLGMSATPERTNNPQKVYELFDYNVAYEIRLKQAMEFNLLCPFHYYGISDLTINGKIIHDKTKFKELTSKARAKHIIKAINTYGYCGDKPHGLIFVSRSDEAVELSRWFSVLTEYKTIALTSNNSNDESRRKSIEMLEENDISKDYLDYIFTVDLFNEGVDIPCVNQIVMARQTESSIVFIQQLGRGLRKFENKDYVTIIDIIGNYKNNYMIPIALSGSQKFNKDDLRKFIYEGNLNLPGSSTISFDEITKTRIYNSIDSAKLNSIKIIRDEYEKLKARLGNKIPDLMDFEKYSSIDPLIIFNVKGSYYNFLKEYEKDYNTNLSDLESQFIELISKKFASGKRIHELALLKSLLDNKTEIFSNLKSILKNEYGINYNDKTTKTIVNELTGKFNVGSDKKYENVVFIEKESNDYRISSRFNTLIKNKQFTDILIDLLDFGIYRYLNNYSNRYLDTDLVLYQKYSYDDVYRLLNWKKAKISLNVGGYIYDVYSNTFPVFINYDKTEAAETIKYQDKIIDRNHINAISKHPRTIKSKDAKIINNASVNNTKIHMFIRKNKLDDVKEFYYLGLVDKCGELESSKDPKGENIFIIPYRFETPIREDILSYICN